MAKLKVTLDDLAGRMSKEVNFAPCIDRIGVKLVSAVKRRFEAGQSPDGKSWAPLKRPRPSGGAGLPLLDTGILRSSVTVPGSKGSIFEKSANRIEAGTNLDYGSVHQFGGVIRPKNAKLLAIPVTKEAQRIGSPRNWPDGKLQFRFGKDGKAGVAFTTKKGKGNSLVEEVQYYFAKKVTIPARPFIGISESEEKDLQELVADFVQEAVVDNLVGSGGV